MLLLKRHRLKYCRWYFSLVVLFLIKLKTRVLKVFLFISTKLTARIQGFQPPVSPALKRQALETNYFSDALHQYVSTTVLQWETLSHSDQVIKIRCFNQSNLHVGCCGCQIPSTRVQSDYINSATPTGMEEALPPAAHGKSRQSRSLESRRNGVWCHLLTEASK